jgi:hypothetical protein
VFVVIAEEGRRRWVSGLFQEQGVALAYLAEIPDELRRCQTVISAGVDAYPVYLVESDDGFFVHSPQSLVSFLDAVPRTHDDDFCYFNVYKFLGDWRPDRAGSDFMGAIPHVHVHNGHLDQVREDGVEALW